MSKLKSFGIILLHLVNNFLFPQLCNIITSDILQIVVYSFSSVDIFVDQLEWIINKYQSILTNPFFSLDIIFSGSLIGSTICILVLQDKTSLSVSMGGTFIWCWWSLCNDDGIICCFSRGLFSFSWFNGRFVYWSMDSPNSCLVSFLVFQISDFLEKWLVVIDNTFVYFNSLLFHKLILFLFPTHVKCSPLVLLLLRPDMQVPLRCHPLFSVAVLVGR